MEITQKSYQKASGYKSSSLVLVIKGSKINCSIVNALRKYALSGVPCYAFVEDLINITRNTTIYDNSRMRTRLSQMVVHNINSDLSYIDDIYWKDVDYSDEKRPRHQSDNKIIMCNIDVKHSGKTNDVELVTSDDIIFTLGEKVLDKPFGDIVSPLIIDLKPGHAFSCTMKAALGVAFRNDIWSASANVFYNMVDNDPHHFSFTINSMGHLGEHDILIKSCIGIVALIKQKVSIIHISENGGSNYKLILEIPQYIGNILNRFMQDNDKVKYSGIHKPDRLDKFISISVILNKGMIMKKVLDEAITSTNKVMSEIRIALQNIKTKHNIKAKYL